MAETSDTGTTTSTRITETGAPAGEGAAQIVSTETVTRAQVEDHLDRVDEGVRLAEAAGIGGLGDALRDIRDEVALRALPTEEYVVLTPIRYDVTEKPIEPGTRLALTVIEAAELLATGAIGRLGAGVIAGPALLGSRLFGLPADQPANPALRTVDPTPAALGLGRPLR